MLTISTDRFQKIQKEAPLEYQSYLVQVTKYQAAQNCKVLSFSCQYLSLALHTQLKISVNNNAGGIC
jgi:hypothetical protein